jgi:hypothetical protein
LFHYPEERGVYGNDNRERLKGNEVDETNFLIQRKEHSAAILEKLRNYLEKRRGEIAGKRLLGKAVSYTLN